MADSNVMCAGAGTSKLQAQEVWLGCLSGRAGTGWAGRINSWRAGFLGTPTGGPAVGPGT